MERKNYMKVRMTQEIRVRVKGRLRITKSFTDEYFLLKDFLEITRINGAYYDYRHFKKIEWAL